MGAANVYLGLYAGMTVSASIPAAGHRHAHPAGARSAAGTILEANQVQTAASAGESLAAGVIFTLPALVMIGIWNEFPMLLTAAISFTGGLLGILFMIPMRRVFVVGDSEELKFPEGVACAAVLEAGQEKASHAISIIKGALYGAVIKGPRGVRGSHQGPARGRLLRRRRRLSSTSPVTSPRRSWPVAISSASTVAALVFTGGFISWIICLPLVGAGRARRAHRRKRSRASRPRTSATSASVPWWSGACRRSSVYATASCPPSATCAAQRAAGARLRSSAPSRTIPAWAIRSFSALAVVLVAAIYYFLTDDIAITLVTAVIMVVMSFFFTAVASYIVGLVGNSNSPVSGMTITAVLFTGAIDAPVRLLRDHRHPRHARGGRHRLLRGVHLGGRLQTT